MKMHVLPGDSLVAGFQQTGIKGEITVCRECLIDGDLLAKSLGDFWQTRENYLSSAYPEAEKSYSKNVKAEFEKLLDLEDGSEIYLWFEHELFCQANMWFCLWLLHDKNIEFYRVAPIVNDEKNIWKGFGVLDKSELEKCFERKIKFSKEEVQLGKQLWKAFYFEDFVSLKMLGKTESECFPHLEEVCRAAIEKNTRPKKVIEKIIADGANDFGQVFRIFYVTEGVYGFGDSQVKRIYDEVFNG